MDAIATQASMRAFAEEQADALDGVRSWMTDIKAKDSDLLRKKQQDNSTTSTASAPSGAPPSLRLPESREEVAGSLKRKGNELMEVGSHREAADMYTRAIALAPDSWSLYANRCQAYINTKEFRAAIFDATYALKSNPAHVKSWYRRGCARNSIGLHEAAERDLRIATALDPTNRAAQVEMRKASESMRAAKGRIPDISIPITLRIEALE